MRKFTGALPRSKGLKDQGYKGPEDKMIKGLKG